MSRLARRAGDAPGDADLLLRVRAGDRGAMDDLYDRFRCPAFALARGILSDDISAEDVLHSAFLGVWRNPWGYDRSHGSFSSWLMAVVHQEAVEALRREEGHRRRHSRALDDPAPSASHDVEDDGGDRLLSRAVRTVLGSLPDDQREALALAYYGGYTQREVAALAGTPLGTVKTRMLAGMRRMTEEFGGASEDPRARPAGPGGRGDPVTEPRGVSRREEEHALFDEIAVGWALHALEPEEETLFAAHLPGCARCRCTVTGTSQVMDAMAADLPPVAPSPRLRDRLSAAVEATEQLRATAGESDRPVDLSPAEDPAGLLGNRPATGFPDQWPGPTGPAGSPPAWRRVLLDALVAAAVVAILALGTWNVALTSARDEAREAAAQQADMVNALLTPGRAAVVPLSGDDGVPVASVVARSGQVQVLAHGLTVNDERTQTYVVWGTAEGPPVPLGAFDVTSPRMDLRTVGSASTDLDDYTGYAISLEPGRRMPSEPTDVVASGEVTS